MKKFILSLLSVCLLSSVAVADLRIATWNIYWLVDGGNNKRTENDYAELREIADNLKADVIALQEVDEITAARVFPSDKYHLEISTGNTSQLTGFAIARHVNYKRQPDYDALNTTSHLRAGTVIDVGDIRLMSVHLKSGCFTGDLDQPGTDACKKLSRQVPVLESWMDIHAARQIIVLGDFNRRMDINDDDLWVDIADGDPLPFTRLNAGLKPKCYGGKFGEFIDHIIASPSAALRFIPGSVREVTYGSRPYGPTHKLLSDHCPLTADLR